MSEPLCLVSPLLGLNRAALAHLRALPGPLLLLGVWGPRGTGKSFLLDQLAGRGTGFGPTPGLWLRWLPHPTRPGTMLVLLDSEGLQEQSEGGEGVSSGLFCLSVLLCTVFVFNSRGAEEPQRELDRLSGCLEGLLRRVRVLEDCPQENSFLLSSVLPEFVWCLRDAAPDCLWDELLRATGHDMGTLLSSSDESEDSPGRSIQRLFPSQKAFCFRPPTLDESERELFPSEKTHPVFQKQLGAFKDYVLSREPRAGVSGEVLCSRLQRFVGALSRDQPILLSETFQSWGAAAPGSTWEEEAEERFLAAEPPRAAPVVEEIPRGSEAHIWGAQEEEWPEEEREGNRWRDPGPGEAVEELDFQPPLGPRAASPAPLPVAMEAPICLIENGPRQPLRINAEALRILQRIHQPVVVVAIVGLYRTGKSYLMNRLAGRGAGGFSLGATVQANTKGIWMWCLPHPLRADQALVLLDTEGLGDVEKSNTENDSWIFALSVLLSSTFVYNSMGTINHYALEQMHFVTELSRHIKTKASDRESHDLASAFPAFIWAVRDFTLQLCLEDGTPITEDQYLERALERRAEAPESQDLPKRCIRELFPSRKCFVFDRPALRQDLQCLEELPESQLSQEFLEQAHRFCRHVQESARAKTVQGGRLVTGTLLASLAESYVGAIRRKEVPCIENAVLALAQLENAAAVHEALQRYEEMEELMRPMLPMEDVAGLLVAHGCCEEEALRVFMGRAFRDEGQRFQRQLADHLQEKLGELCRRNEGASLDRCQAVLMELYQEVEDKVMHGRYLKRGGYQRFLSDRQSVVERYHQVEDKGLMAAKALQDFLASKEEAAQSILQADQTLTEKEKELEAEKVRAEAAQREAQLQREMQERAEQMAREKERSFEEHKKQLMAKVEQERRALLAEQERLLQQRLQEQRRLQEEGFHREVSRLQGEIQGLRHQIQERRSSGGGGICTVS
ncbi:guanylate-binding protein 1 isoform X1 [Anolis carolinensis]|uniref:guanylate-binding protein 1 isoform X1 n=2 Tax=Anolis carolinensis TaxID=28377 RepID=UPI002F2B1B6B